MAGARWGPPCFGFQGGHQQAPAIPLEKSILPSGNFETKCPKAAVIPAHFYIGTPVAYPPMPPLFSHEWEKRGEGLG